MPTVRGSVAVDRGIDSSAQSSKKLGRVKSPRSKPIEDHASLLRAMLEEDPSNHRVTVLKKTVLDRLNGKQRLGLVALEEEYLKVHQVVEQTILAGEGNSMVIIGARGTGKSTLVETVLGDLSSQHRDYFHVVRLSGFIHTDDKLALREIWRQLDREMQVEDEATARASSYADTLSSLLALLSHPGELAEDDMDRTAKSVIFVLEEFDLFTSHSRQTLLYNLFDIAQSRKAPITVLGLTTKIDVAESLEKRVKSRFSHRFVYLSLPRTLLAFWEICRKALVVDEQEIIEANQGLVDTHTNNENMASFLGAWEHFIDVCLL